mgnify:CR=1 FL=1
MAAAVASGAIATSGDDIVELVAVALVRGGVPVRAVGVVDVPWYRDPDDRIAAEAAVRGVSEARIRQLQANRLDDGFYSTFVVRRLSKPLTRLALRLGWSPNAITLLSFAVGLLAAACAGAAASNPAAAAIPSKRFMTDLLVFDSACNSRTVINARQS